MLYLAKYYAGRYVQNGIEGDYFKSISGYVMTAEIENKEAIDTQEKMYADSIREPIESPNTNKLFLWSMMATKLNHTKSIHLLGGLYHPGVGVEKDYSQALSWYLRATEAGDIEAMKILGDMYEKGLGTYLNPEQSKEWYEKATNTLNQNNQKTPN